MEFIDTRAFIAEVHKRPSLWNSTCEDYKNHDLKRDGWTEVCTALIPDYDEKDEQEKMQNKKELQMKWRHVRDAYVRYARLVRTKSFLNSSKPIKTYIYAKHLTFLEDVINYKISMTRQNNSDSSVNEQNDDNDFEIVKEEPHFSSSIPFKRNKKDVGEKMISYVDVRQEQPKKPEYKSANNEDDMAFFKSLLPTLQTLNHHQKLSFRVDVMKLLMAYNEPSSIDPLSTSIKI